MTLRHIHIQIGLTYESVGTARALLASSCYKLGYNAWTIILSHEQDFLLLQNTYNPNKFVKCKNQSRL